MSYFAGGAEGLSQIDRVTREIVLRYQQQIDTLTPNQAKVLAGDVFRVFKDLLETEPSKCVLGPSLFRHLPKDKKYLWKICNPLTQNQERVSAYQIFNAPGLLMQDQRGAYQTVSFLAGDSVSFSYRVAYPEEVAALNTALEKRDSGGVYLEESFEPLLKQTSEIEILSALDPFEFAGFDEKTMTENLRKLRVLVLRHQAHVRVLYTSHIWILFQNEMLTAAMTEDHIALLEREVKQMVERPFETAVPASLIGMFGDRGAPTSVHAGEKRGTDLESAPAPSASGP